MFKNENGAYEKDTVKGVVRNKPAAYSCTLRCDARGLVRCREICRDGRCRTPSSHGHSIHIVLSGQCRLICTFLVIVESSIQEKFGFFWPSALRFPFGLRHRHHLDMRHCSLSPSRFVTQLVNYFKPFPSFPAHLSFA